MSATARPSPPESTGKTRADWLNWLMAPLGGPLLGKELRELSRRKRLYWLRAGYVALLLLFAASAWWRNVEPAGSLVSVARMSDKAESVAHAILLFQHIACPLLAMVLLSPSIASERQRRTLNVLLASLPRGQVVLGKLWAGLLPVLQLIACSLPVIMLLGLLGGVSWRIVAVATFLTLTHTLLVASLSLLASSMARKVWRAFFLAMGLQMALFVVAPAATVLLAFLMSGTHEVAMAMTLWVMLSHPFLLFTAVLGKSTLGIPSETLYVQPTVSLAVAAIALGLTRRKLSSLASMAAGVTPHEADGHPVVPAQPPPTWEATPDLRPSIGTNPVLWRELRSPLVRSILWQGLIYTGAVLLLLILYAVAVAWTNSTRNGGPLFHGGLAAVLTALGLLLSGLVAAASVTSEKESRSIEILLTTPITAWKVVTAKGFGALRRSALPWSILLLDLLMAAMAEGVGTMSLLHVPMSVGAFLCVVIPTAVLISTLCRRTVTAAAWALALGVGVFLLPWMLFGDVVRPFALAIPYVQTSWLVEYSAIQLSGPGLPDVGDAYAWDGWRGTGGQVTTALTVQLGVAVLYGSGCLAVAAKTLRWRALRR